MGNGHDIQTANRRPIAARGNALIRSTSAWLARIGLSPNVISIASIAFAGAGAAALAWAPPWGAWACALGIVLRLLCNVFDGLVAVEHGRKTPAGALYNEVPDRIADSVVIVALGYAVGAPWLGWLGALLAMGTAYVRTLGGALGQPQDFRGPLAKQHRMWVMVLGCIAAPLEWHVNASAHVLYATAAIIAGGSALTCALRLCAIARRLYEAG